MTEVPNLTMNTGRAIPQLGFGVFQIPQRQVADAVRTALEAGYRLIDTAAAYGNEEGVGKALAQSGLPREEIFVTTKLANSDHGRAGAALEQSLDRLGLDSVDLYLIHWPMPRRGDYVDTWRELEKLHAEGRATAIGVSNFEPDHLERLLAEGSVVPAVNQVELHPGFAQERLRAFDAEHGILTEAWSPIGQGRGLLDDPAVTEIAEAHGRSPAQVVLRWHIQLGTLAIPKSVTPERIRDNIAVFDFALSEEEMRRLSALEGGRFGPDPHTFEMD